MASAWLSAQSMSLMVRSRLPHVSQAMLVIAHPDDETMFFSPTLHELRSQGCSVTILCLSNGNHGGVGVLRGNELLAACCILGIGPGQIVLVDHTKLQDGPQCQWPPELVASLIAKEAEKCKADMIVTFDAKGVSGHPNHIAVWRGAVQPYEAVQALKAHKSQYVWYRQLFIRLSSFTYTNTLSKLES